MKKRKLKNVSFDIEDSNKKDNDVGEIDEMSTTHSGMAINSKNFLGKSDTKKMKDMGYDEISIKKESILKNIKTIKKYHGKSYQ